MGDFEVTRTTTIAAPPERVHGLVDDFHAWRTWSPWEDTDPDLRREYAGAESGVVRQELLQRLAAVGDLSTGLAHEVNNPLAAILGSAPERVDVRLRFEKPFKATNDVAFELTPADGGGTGVTWRMSGRTSGVAAVFGKIVPMDRLVGKDFEKGLARLKVAAEAP